MRYPLISMIRHVNRCIIKHTHAYIYIKKKRKMIYIKDGHFIEHFKVHDIILNSPMRRSFFISFYFAWKSLNF